MAKTLTLAQRAKKDPKLLARVLKNPGLRSKLPTSMLPADMRNRRALNQRLKQPITDGSSITERDLARESKSAMDVKYGPVEQAQGQRVQEEQQRQRDFTGPGGFYDQYLHQMAENSKQVQNIGAATVGAGLAAQRGVAGLAGADFTQLQGQANQSAALNGVAPANDMTKVAADAASTRQALVGSFVSQQAAQAAATQTYADSMARVVGPQQKLAGAAMQEGRIREKREDQLATSKQRGSDDVAYRAGKRADEAKLVLAKQTLGANVAENRTQAQLERDKLKAGTKAAADKTTADTKADADKQARIDATPNQYGIPNGEWATMTTKARQKVIADFKAKSGTGAAGKKGPKWLTPEQASAGVSQLGQLKDAVTRAKTGKAFIEGHAGQKKLDKAGARQKILGYAPLASKLKHPALVDAAVDAMYDGFINNTTVAALKQAGYKPSEVATALGVKTSGQVKDGSKSYGGPH
jgi:hypothetical protein